MLFTSLLRIYLTRSLRPFVFTDQYDNQLNFEHLDDLGLYVHIPFCLSMCSFCPYCKTIYSREKANGYKVDLLKEIDLVCQPLKGKKEASSLYFGGGTPALMVDDLPDIIGKLKEYFTISGGIGVELHPRDITLENLEKLQAAGVTMVSLGIQSFDEESLHKLGRSGDGFLDKLRLVRDQGFAVVDVDLIFAIPGQTDEMLERDLLTAFANGATQVSTYPFIDFTFADNAYRPMPNKIKKAMLKKLSDCCSQNHLARTSVWTFGKANTEKYSSVTRDTFLGFGLSATSLLQGSFKMNTFSLEGYHSRLVDGLLPTSLTLQFSLRQRAAYYLFWSAYGMKLPAEKFEKIIGVPLNRMLGRELFLAEKTGFIRKSSQDYVLTDKGAEVYHTIEQVYTTAYIDKMWSISQTIPFPDKIVLK